MNRFIVMMSLVMWGAFCAAAEEAAEKYKRLKLEVTVHAHRPLAMS